MFSRSQFRVPALVLIGVLAMACDCGKAMVTRTRVDVYMYSSSDGCDAGVLGPAEARSRTRDVLRARPKTYIAC